jgi:acetyl-CoA carboxylase biotin carboxyl carrier protein
VRRGPGDLRWPEITEVDASELKDLMQLISDSNFVEFEMEQEGFKLRLIKAGAGAAQTAQLYAQGHQPTYVLAGPAGQHSGAVSVPGDAATPAPAVPEEKLHIIQSPIVGTFYRSPSPDAPPYAEVGNRVKKGQIICIVEAMKLMNEIESEVSGEVVEVLPSNGQPVEYGEPLFRIRPSE